MQKQRILWFQDGVKMKSPRQVWDKIDGLNNKLIDITKADDFEHGFIRPEVCAENLFNQINPREFTAIVDLSGMFGDFLRQTHPGISVVDTFRLSRIRVVSSPRLDGVGFIMSLSQDQVRKITESTDLSHPLFLDDVSWSGRTVVEAAKVLGAELNNSTFGFLSANIGTFGEGKPGAIQLLEHAGGKTFVGFPVETPRDDGFHLADFFNNPFIGDQETFDTIIGIQKLRELATKADPPTKKQLDSEIRRILVEHRNILFPNSISSEEMQQLQNQGKLIIREGINRNAFFGTNPLNWLMPSFSKRVQVGRLEENKGEITNVLRELKALAVDNEVKLDTDREIRSISPFGKERL